MDQHSTSREPHLLKSARKRQKVVIACDRCRTRKVKCDGCRPVCSQCQKQRTSAECTWDERPSRVNHHASLQYVQLLEDRIRELEQQRLPPTQSCPEDNTEEQATWMDTSLLSPSGRTSISQGEVQRTGKHQSSLMDVRMPFSDPGEQSALAASGGMSVMIGPATNESRRQQLSESSSARSFIQHVRQVAEQKKTPPTMANGSVPTRDQDNLPLMVPNEDLKRTTNDYTLPTRTRADGLMSVYWTYVHTLYPILEKQMTTADYERLWMSDSCIPHERSFLCLLNIIFSLTSQLTDAVEPYDRAASAAVFFTGARELLDIDSNACVRYVQIFLLFGMYLQSTNEPHQCWVFVGLAIRTAQSLELHIPERNERPTEERHRALLRRVWHGCVLMDRVMALTYGRPCMIDRKVALSVPHPLPVEGEELLADPGMSTSLGETEHPTLVDFFSQSLALYDILHDILLNFYSPETSPIQSLDDVYRCYFEGLGREFSIHGIDRRLYTWEKGLPSYLRASSYPAQHRAVTVLSRQAVVIRQRYLHVRLLSLRPVLSAFISLDSHERDGHPWLDSFLCRPSIFHCSVLCVRVAQEAVELVHDRRTEDPGASADLAAWWYNVLYLYTAGTVLVAARLSPFILSEISEAAIFDSWRQVMQALDRYTVFGSQIKHLMSTLGLLFDTVPQHFSRLRPIPEENFAQQQRNDLANATLTLGQDGLVDSRSTAMSRDLTPTFFERNIADMDGFGFDLNNPAALLAAFDTNDMSWLTTVPFEM